MCANVCVYLCECLLQEEKATEQLSRVIDIDVWLAASSFGILAAHYDNGLFVCI